jgi:hypothetical protein
MTCPFISLVTFCIKSLVPWSPAMISSFLYHLYSNWFGFPLASHTNDMSSPICICVEDILSWTSGAYLTSKRMKAFFGCFKAAFSERQVSFLPSNSLDAINVHLRAAFHRLPSLSNWVVYEIPVVTGFPSPSIHVSYELVGIGNDKEKIRLSFMINNFFVIKKESFNPWNGL